MSESTSQHTQDEWNLLISQHPPGTTVSGTVIGRQRFGVFVRLDDLADVPALLEIIHFEMNETSPNDVIPFPTGYPQIGDKIQARILAWCAKPNDVRLTQLSHLNWVSKRPTLADSENDGWQFRSKPGCDSKTDP